MGRSAGGLVLLLVGAAGLIGFLTGNLNRWLDFLFVPPGSTATSSIAPSATASSAPGTAPTNPGRAT